MERGSAEEAIFAQERDALDRWSSGDPEGYVQSADEDVTYVDFIGAHVRVDGIQALREYLAGIKGQFPAHTYEVVNPRIQVYGDVGILTQHYYPTSLEGEAMGPSKATCVYRRTDGTWHLVHSHWSILKEG